MRASLLGMGAVDWAAMKPNNLDGKEIPALLRQWARAHEQDEYAAYQSPSYRLHDALLHQGTRFGGAAEALPFLVEMALADETPWRPMLVRLIVGIGEPLDFPADTPYDRDLIMRLTPEELWEGDIDVINGFAVMCATEGRQAWLENAARMEPLLDDPDPVVRDVVCRALAALEEST